MNRICPVCEADLLDESVTEDLVPYSSWQRGPPEGAHWSQIDRTNYPIGGLWFDSRECRDEYKEANDE